MIYICIYVDVLIVLNIYITYFLLMAVSKISHTPIKLSRCIISSVAGGLFSLIILIPDMNYFVNIFLKLAVSVIIIMTGFGMKTGFKYTMKLILWFYAMNFIFAGIMLSLRYAFSLSFMRYSNSYFYMDFSLFSLIIFTIISYAVVCLIRYIIDKGNVSGGVYKVIIRNNGRVISVEGIADTGNSLVDNFSGKPVIICGKSELEKIIEIPEFSLIGGDYAEYSEILKNFRIIPYSTIGESGIIPVFSPDEILIREEKSQKIKQADALIGISSKNIKAVFNPEILKW